MPKYRAVKTDVSPAALKKRIAAGWTQKDGVWSFKCRNCHGRYSATEEHFYLTTQGYLNNQSPKAKFLMCKHCASHSGPRKKSVAQSAQDHLISLLKLKDKTPYPEWKPEVKD